MEIVEMICQNCGGKLKFEAGKEIISCPFCGSERIIIESDELKATRINAELEHRKLDYQIEKDKREKEAISIRQFREGKISKVIIVSGVISLLFGIGGFNNNYEYWLSSSIAIIQTILFTISWLMGYGIIKKNRERYGIMLLISFLLVIPFCLFIP